MQVETQHYDFYNKSKKCEDDVLVVETSNLNDCIRKIVKNEGYIACDVTKKMLPADGGNFLATLWEIDIKGKTANGEKETALFVKSITSDCEAMELLSVPNVYKTELFVYNELTQLINEFQDKTNIPHNERYNFVKCYKESNDMAIIMENITKKGFKTWYRMDVVSLSMAEKSVKQLAKFHALSFILEQGKPDYYNAKIKSIKNSHLFGDAWEKYVNKAFKEGLELIGRHLSKKIEKKIPKLMKNFEEYYTDESIKECLCHGDYRPNNVMIKEIDGIVTDIIPVDYQLIYYGSPVIDLLYFMYTATDRKFRESHTNYLKDLYYTTFTNYLQHFDILAESVFPRKTFENLYQEKMDFGLSLTFIVIPFLFVSEGEEVPDVTKNNIMEIDVKFDDRFKLRLKDAVEEYIDLVLL